MRAMQPAASICSSMAARVLLDRYEDARIHPGVERVCAEAVGLNVSDKAGRIRRTM
jgi:hypothetical protein